MPDTLNADGLLIRFGRSQSQRGSRAAVTVTRTKSQEMVATFTLTGAARTIYPGDGGLSRFTGNDTPIPAGAVVRSVAVVNKQTPAGGTNYQVSTFNADGSTQTAGGLLTTAGAQGSVVGTQLTTDAYVSVTTTGTYTAGVVEVIIRYDIA